MPVHQQQRHEEAELGDGEISTHHRLQGVGNAWEVLGLRVAHVRMLSHGHMRLVARQSASAGPQVHARDSIRLMQTAGYLLPNLRKCPCTLGACKWGRHVACRGPLGLEPMANLWLGCGSMGWGVSKGDRPGDMYCSMWVGGRRGRTCMPSCPLMPTPAGNTRYGVGQDRKSVV